MKLAVRAVRSARRALGLAFASLLAACGGSGGYGGPDDGGGNGGTGWTPGVFLPADSFYAKCVSPRSGTDPLTGQPYLDVLGTRTDENNFLRSYSNDTYLWYDEITDRDPALYQTLEYFDLLKTTASTPSGTAKDQFHFTFDTDEYVALVQSGESAGYGAQWAILRGDPPRQVVVAYTDPNTPATAPTVGLARGDEVLSADGVSVSDGNPDPLNAAFFPAAAGETHSFLIRDRETLQTRTITMQSAIITSAPVQNVSFVDRPGGRVGYLLFNDHIATAETGLYNAVNNLAAAGVDELVVDLRYNGGGFLDIASEFAYMIAGGARTAGTYFERLEFNDQHPSTDPVTGAPLEPIPFHNRSQGFSLPDGTLLPSLNLARVFVLTGAGTCSASESIMNSLRGIGVEVIQIGGTTCGKPYGFYPTDNCGTTYFTIQFRGTNFAGFGDYADGFRPANSTLPIGTPVPGCAIADDFGRDLGDPLEDRYAEALAWVDTGQCTSPPSASTVQSVEAPASDDAQDAFVPKSPWHTNRILRQRP
ncbi:MAG: S41 family peptidase [Gammaproteobacteria bacterium]|nr:S41 family peptidase [Gammaproteobacteria bacterium]